MPVHPKARIPWWKVVPALLVFTLSIGSYLAAFAPEVPRDVVGDVMQVAATILGLIVAGYVFLLGHLQSKTGQVPAAKDLRDAQASLYHGQLVLFVVMGAIGLLLSAAVQMALSAGWTMPVLVPWSIGLNLSFVGLAMVIMLFAFSPMEPRRVSEIMLGVARRGTARTDSREFARLFRELEHEFHKRGFSWEEWRSLDYDPSIEPVWHDAAEILHQDGAFADTRRCRWVRDLLKAGSSRWVLGSDLEALQRAVRYWKSFGQPPEGP